MALSVECANHSPQWREKFGVPEDEPNEVRGMLFVHNHDFSYQKSFYDELKRVNSSTLPLASSSVLHFLGPNDIQRLYTIANDIIRLQHGEDLPKEYHYYYPDLVLRRRRREIQGQAATFESICGPFLIIKHDSSGNHGSGYLIYYNRPGDRIEEFEYLIDCLSRFQILDSTELIRIRVVHSGADDDLKSRFETATRKYARSWGFGESRVRMLKAITIDRVTAVAANYNPGDMGWRQS